MIGANNLIPLTKAQEDAEDELLASLSSIAYSVPLAKKSSDRKYKSRFFFRLSPSFDEEVKAKKAKTKPKQMEHIDEEVVKRLKKYRREIPNDLMANIEDVREFFLKEISPLTFATTAGTAQALEVTRRMLKTDVDSTQFDKFDRMTQAAVNFKMAKFLARYFGLPKASAKELMALTAPKQPMIVPIPSPSPNSEPRHERIKKQQQKGKEEDPYSP